MRGLRSTSTSTSTWLQNPSVFRLPDRERSTNNPNYRMGVPAPAPLEDDGVEVVEDNKNNTSIKNTTTTTLIFTYGTLKHGFSNHRLLHDMMSTGDASYLGLCRTADKLPLVCGPYRVPFLLNFQGQGLGHHVWGELYAVSAVALARMDDLEGVTRGHYERLPINVLSLKKEEEDDRGTMLSSSASAVTPAEAYYAHRSYAEALWRRNGEMGYHCYSEKVAKGYVKRKDRPQHISFLDQIQLFVSDDHDHDHDHDDPLQH